VDAGEATRRVARLLCAGGSDVSTRKAGYRGLESCAAAVAVGGGGKGCAWGCVGLGDCAVACTFDAITMTDRGLPLDAHLLVQCRSLLEGPAATTVCSVACNACGRCAADAPGLISMENGLAVVDYERIELESAAAVARCPTGAIAWVEGGQFAAPPLHPTPVVGRDR
jgi:ferredoxin